MTTKEILPYTLEPAFPQRQPVEQPFSLREFLSIFFRDGKRIAAAFLIPMFIITLISFLPTPKYEASSTLLVKMGREYLYRPEVGEANTQPVAIDRTQAMQSEVEILNSRDLLEKVIAQVGLKRLYPSIADGTEDPEMPNKDKALVQLGKQLDVQALKDSNILQVSFKHPSPEIAAETVNRLVANYLQKRRSIYSDSQVGLAENQAKSMKTRLLDLENRIEQFKRQHNIVSFQEQLALMLNQRDDLEVKLKAASTNLAEVSGKLDAVRKTSATVKDNVQIYSENTRDDTLENARKALLDLRLKEGDAAAKYTDNNPVVVDLRRQIQRASTFVKELETKRADTVRVGRNPVKDTIENDLLRLSGEQQSAQASKVVLTNQLATINEQISALSKQQPELDNMMRERQLLETSYQNYVKRFEESRVMADLDRNAKTNVSIVQAALPPVEKKNLQIIILAVGLVLSGCIALLVAFLSEMLRGTYISPEKLQRSLGIPVLASIPYREDGPRKLQFAS